MMNVAPRQVPVSSLCYRWMLWREKLCTQIESSGHCIGYGDMYTGCIVPVVDEGDVVVMMVKEKKP